MKWNPYGSTPRRSSDHEHPQLKSQSDPHHPQAIATTCDYLVVAIPHKQSSPGITRHQAPIVVSGPLTNTHSPVIVRQAVTHPQNQVIARQANTYKRPTTK